VQRRRSWQTLSVLVVVWGICCTPFCRYFRSSSFLRRFSRRDPVHSSQTHTNPSTLLASHSSFYSLLLLLCTHPADFSGGGVPFLTHDSQCPASTQLLLFLSSHQHHNHQPHQHISNYSFEYFENIFRKIEENTRQVGIILHSRRFVYLCVVCVCVCFQHLWRSLRINTLDIPSASTNQETSRNELCCIVQLCVVCLFPFGNVSGSVSVLSFNDGNICAVKRFFVLFCFYFLNGNLSGAILIVC
jgi:hypothetical protein